MGGGKIQCCCFLLNKFQFVTLSRITWILIPALLSDAIALIKGMGKGDFRVGHARDVPTLVRIVFLHLPTSLPMGMLRYNAGGVVP